MDKIQEHHFYINLYENKTRNSETIDELIKFGINNPRRFDAIKHDSNIGIVGCAYSHIGCIEYAKKNNWPFVCVFEDDIIFRKINECRDMLNKYIDYDYDVLFLGAWILDNKYKFVTDDLININTAYCMHAYIVKSHYYDTILENLYEGVKLKIDGGLDDHKNRLSDKYNNDVYTHSLQLKDKWYCLLGNYVSQIEGYSDDFDKYINFTDTIFNVPIHDKSLPNISILTPTGNRKMFLPLMISNIKRFNYPKDKIEWNILDSNDKKLMDFKTLFDSKDEIKNLEKELGIKINYKYISGSLTIGQKRNILCDISNTEYLINMDDDDIYINTYLNHSIERLLHNNKDITGCLEMLIMYPDKDYNITYTKTVIDYSLYNEATVCLKKSHWMKYKYKETSKGEGINLFGNKDVCAISSIFNCMVCTGWHNNTVSKEIFNKKLSISVTDICKWSKDNTILESLNILKNILIRDIMEENKQKELVTIDKELLVKIRNIILVANERINWKIEELLPVGKVIEEIDNIIK